MQVGVNYKLMTGTTYSVVTYYIHVLAYSGKGYIDIILDSNMNVCRFN